MWAQDEVQDKTGYDVTDMSPLFIYWEKKKERGFSALSVSFPLIASAGDCARDSFFFCDQ